MKDREDRIIKLEAEVIELRAMTSHLHACLVSLKTMIISLSHEVKEWDIDTIDNTFCQLSSQHQEYNASIMATQHYFSATLLRNQIHYPVVQDEPLP
jgi:hypothetical protein